MAPPSKTSIMLVSGEYFDPFEPDPSVITLDVLEHGLDVPRFNNQTIRPISIAEHSLRVRRIARELAQATADDDHVEAEARAAFEASSSNSSAVLINTWRTLPPNARENWRQRAREGSPANIELWAINHDNHEALVPWGDCLQPGKTDEMREVETEVDTAVREALGIPLPSARAFNIVKTADAIALYFEAMLWQPGASDWAPEIRANDWDRLGLVAIDRFLPLIVPRPGECWRTEVETLLGGLGDG